MKQGRLTQLSKTNPKNNLRYYRKLIGIGRRKLARLCKLSEGTICWIELSYTADPILKTKLKILNALHGQMEERITLDDIFPNGNNKPIEKIINPAKERS